MIGLILSDTHLRGDIFHVQMQSLRNIIDEFCPDYILHTGDLFHRGEVGDMALPPQTMIKQFTDYVSELEIPWVILAGNHDYVGNTCALDFLHHPYITPVVKPQFMKVFGHEDYLLLALPWMHGGAKHVQQFLEQRKPLQVPLIILGHADLYGYTHRGRELTAKTSAYCLNPLWWEHLNPVACYFGHIHHKDLNATDTVGYTGSTWATNFGETDIPGYATVIRHYGSELSFESYAVGDLVLRYVDAQKTYLKNLALSKSPKIFVRSDKEITDLPENFHVKVVKPAKVRSQNSTAVLDLKHTYHDYLKHIGQKPTKGLEEIWERFRPIVNQVSISAPPIERLLIKNVGTISKRNLEFSPKFNVLTGKSGQGKTSALESIPLCLYGAFPDDRKVGNFTEKSSRVSVLTKNNQYSRGWSGEKYVVGETSVPEVAYAKEVEKVFGPKNLFFATVFQSQQKSNDLIRAKSTARMDVLRELYGLSDFDSQHERVKAELKKSVGKEFALKNLLESYEQKTAKAAAHETRMQLLRKEIADLKQKMSKLRDTKTDLKEKLSAKEKLAYKIQNYYDTVFRSAVVTWNTTRQHYEQALANYKKRAEKAGCLQDGKTLPCPLLQEPEKPKRPFWAKWAKALHEDPASIDFTDAPPEARQQFSKYVEMQTSLEAIVKEIQVLQQTQEKQDETLPYFYGEKNGELTTLSAETKALAEQIASLKAEIKRTEDEVEYYKNLAIMEKILSPYGLVQWWLQQRLPELEDQTNSILEEVEDGINLRIQFEFSAGKIPKLEIHVIDEKPKRLVESCSGGEKALISLSLLLALTGGTVFLDEPFVGLDQESVAVAAKFLSKISEERQIITVTHEPAAKNYADAEIKF